MVRFGWMPMVLAGCGPTVAVGGDESGSTTGSPNDADSADEPDSEGGAATTDGSLTVSSTAADTGAIDPPLGCATPGACDGECTDWQLEYRGPSAGEAQLGAVAIAPDGEIVVAGMADDDDFVLVGYDSGGVLLWEETPLGTDDGAQDMPWRMAIGSDGDVAVAGQRNVPGLPSWWVLLDARDDVHRQVVEFPGGAWIGALFFAADGSLIVGGGGDGPGSFVQRYSAAGDLLDEWDDDDLGFEGAVVLGGVSISASTVALVGMQGDEDDVWVTSFDLESGAQWGTTSDGDPSTKQWASDVALLPDGDLVVVGAQREDDGNAVSWAGRFSAAGEHRWTRTYSGTGCCANSLDHVEVDDTGRIFVLGVRGEPLVAKVQELDCDGEIAWEWNHESRSGSSFPNGLAWAEATGLVVTGSDSLSMGDTRGFVSRLTP